MSYFLTSREESVPLPAPGFPNMSIRSILPLLPSSTPARRPRREKGNALPDETEFAIPRVPGTGAARMADAANLASKGSDMNKERQACPETASLYANGSYQTMLEYTVV